MTASPLSFQKLRAAVRDTPERRAFREELDAYIGAALRREWARQEAVAKRRGVIRLVLPADPGANYLECRVCGSGHTVLGELYDGSQLCLEHLPE